MTNFGLLRFDPDRWSLLSLSDTEKTDLAGYLLSL